MAMPGAPRLSNSDRERAVAILNAAVADGRLTWAEHADRVELAWGCRTAAELEPYLADLPAPAIDDPPLRVVAVASKIVRQAEPGRRIEARALFGAVFLTVADAVPGQELLIEASSLCGKVVLIVGAGATVVDEGHAVLAKRKILIGTSSGDGPLIRITGRSVLGHLKVLRSGRGWL